MRGRVANVLSTRFDGLSRAFSRLHRYLYLRSGGRRFTRLNRRPAFVLTVLGRKTGAPRSVMLMLVRRGDDLVVCGSNGGNPSTPNWFRNLVAAGEAEVNVGGSTWAVTARLVEDPDERAACWDLLVAAYPDFASYQSLTDRQLPIAVLRRAA